MSTGTLERRIVIGLIVSTEYAQQVREMWAPKYLQSSAAKRLATWCVEYFDKYEKAPYGDIEGIYIEKLREGNLPKDVAEEIEEDILPGLNEEYEREGQFNFDYLLDQTRQYFKERRLILHSEEVKGLVDTGNVEEAEEAAENYHRQAADVKVGLELNSPEALTRIENAFNESVQRVVTYPGALGGMWNDQLSRGSFVGLMGPDKRGKTYRLMDIGMRGITQKANVAFFQAGDMTEAQQLRRICIYISRKSDKARYCGRLYIPQKDCLLNQLDQCDRKERESDMPAGSLKKLQYPDDKSIRDVRGRLTMDALKRAYTEVKGEYRPCYNCPEYLHGFGSVWLKEVDTGSALEAEEAKRNLARFFSRFRNRFRLSTHVNSTLSVKEIRATLNTWERREGFVPDVVLVDYADLLVSDNPRMDFRHRQDEIWRQLRGLSQERHCLVVTATQADAKSYNQDRLFLNNFSEDKRKYAHVTAMYGLNQDKKGREKKLGLMRINELVVREGDFSNDNEVYIMQKLEMGRPFLGSFK